MGIDYIRGHRVKNLDPAKAKEGDSVIVDEDQTEVYDGALFVDGDLVDNAMIFEITSGVALSTDWVLSGEPGNWRLKRGRGAGAYRPSRPGRSSGGINPSS